MTRKSKQQRINEANELIAAIQADPILSQEQSWLLGFLGDMSRKFANGKGGTTRQRALFDEKIAEGVPARKVRPQRQVQEQVLKAQAVMPLLQNHPDLFGWEIRVGSELVNKGLSYNLSDAQLGLLDSIAQKAEQVEAMQNSPVTDEMLAEAKLLCDLGGTYIEITAKKSKDLRILASAIENGTGFTEEALENGRQAVSGELKKFKKWTRQYPEGTMVRLALGVVPAANGQIGIVLDAPRIINRSEANTISRNTWRTHKLTMIPVLFGDQIIDVYPPHMHKLTKKEIKAASK